MADASSTSLKLLGGWIDLTTHRPKGLGPEASSYFAHEALIAAIAICFFRSTVRLQDYESVTLRWFCSLLLACLAYSKKSYELIVAVEIFSYVVAYVVSSIRYPRADNAITTTITTSGVATIAKPSRHGSDWLFRLFSILGGAAMSLALSKMIVTGTLFTVLSRVTPSLVHQGLNYLFPIEEMKSAYRIMESFANPEVLKKQVQHLFFVTFHAQVGMGYLGIDFLRKEQGRRNELIRLDVMKSSEDSEMVDGSSNNGGINHVNDPGTSKKDFSDIKQERSRRFQRGAAPFIAFVATPYMLQIMLYGNINQFAFVCLKDDLHRAIRLNELFDHDNHLIAIATDSATSPESYADAMDTVVSTSYDMFNRKLFSLPKVLLLPAVMARQPMLVVKVIPFIFVSDWVKASVVAYMTRAVETLQKQIQELNAIRSKVEAFDIKNAELLQRSGKGATQFTQRRWEELTVRVQARVALADLISRSKSFFAFLQRNFVFSVLIDCALANLLAVGKILSSEIFVFSRAIEDAVDMILMRSRGEAELARLMTEVGRLQELNDLWDRSKDRNLLPCTIDPHGQRNMILRNLHYTRGTASVRADHFEFSPGVYALTGANGSGKSTLFRILMSCRTNEQSTDLPPSINLLTPAEPLAEEDDFLRERACLVTDPNTDDTDDCDAGLDASNVRARMATSSESIPSLVPTPVPRLSIIMPSSQIVEISQNFYWPLYSKPIDWIFQAHVTDSREPSKVNELVRRVAEELHSLEFFQAPSVDGDDMNEKDFVKIQEATIQTIMQQLTEEKDDWFADLSGGQKSKVELVRKVFLSEHCPNVLLIDETMAPLDPASKALAMAKIKMFCQQSIVIVIYHTDVGRETSDDGEPVECVPSNGFFDRNIHLEKGDLHLRDTC